MLLPFVMINKTFLLSVVSGIFAAGGSVFGKLVSFQDGSSTISYIIRGICIILMASSNTIGLLYFVKALNSSDSSVPATITSSAVNYCSSALLGWLIFQESCGLLWWIGSTLVMFGIVLINHSSTPEKTD